MEHGVGFQTEGQVTAVSQEGHVEYPGEIKKANVVLPTDSGLVIPHLPKETADKCS